MEPVIPKVNEDVGYSIEKQMESDSFLSDVARHIRENNPTIAGFLHSFTGKLPTCCSRAAMLAAFLTYRLVESQMEADKMKNELKLGDTNERPKD